MEMQRKSPIMLCGLVFMISFLYTYDLLFVSIHEPDREEQFADRELPYYLRIVAEPTRQILFCSALPAWILTKQIYEPYYGELVYYPLIAGIMWFGYGCTIAWGRRAGKLLWVLGSLMVIWSVFLGMYWVVHLR